MFGDQSALWLRYSRADHTAGCRPRGRGRRVDALDRLLATSAPSARSVPSVSDRSYCAPSNRHASQVSTGTGTVTSCRAVAGTGSRMLRPGRRGRGRTGWGCSWASRSGTGSGTIRSERRPASSASEITSRSGSPTRPATRAASSCSTFTRPGLTFTRTGKPATSTVSVCAGRRPAVDGGAAHAERPGLAREHLGDLAR